MKVKGVNNLYGVTIEKDKFHGEDVIFVTAGNLMTGMTSVAISIKNWEKIKKAV